MPAFLLPSTPLQLRHRAPSWRPTRRPGRPPCPARRLRPALAAQRPATQKTKKPKPSILTARNPVLPLLVPLARTLWNTFWRTLMAELAPSDADGRYKRPASSLAAASVATAASTTTDALPDDVRTAVRDAFSQRMDTDTLPPTLYAGLACPWCHRALLARALLKLNDVVAVELVEPGTTGLWRLRRESPDGPLLKDVYLALEPSYAGRFTAPLLVDSDRDLILSNESADILRELSACCARRDLPDGAVVALRPEDPALAVDIAQMDALCERIYDGVNNGVYKVGFATSQLAYDEAEDALFSALDQLERILEHSRFLCSGNVLTEADVRLFPTVVRFDSVYAVLFRACRRTIRSDYPAISAWMRDVYNLPDVAETCDVAGTARNYFANLFPLNASGIVPAVPPLDTSPPVGRVGLGV